MFIIPILAPPPSPTRIYEEIYPIYPRLPQILRPLQAAAPMPLVMPPQIPRSQSARECRGITRFSSVVPMTGSTAPRTDEKRLKEIFKDSTEK